MDTYPKTTLIVLAVVGMLANPMISRSQSPALNDATRPWFLQANFGSARIHSWDDRAGWGEFRIGRTIGAPAVSIDGGVSGSAVPGPFGSMTVGLEYRPLPGKRLSPFFRAETGVLAEPDFAGYVVGGGGGVVLSLMPRLGLRLGAAANFHGGEKGPITTFGGLEYRW